MKVFPELLQESPLSNPEQRMPTSKWWIDQLQGDDATREQAISLLRDQLVRGVERSFANRGVDRAFAEDISQDALLRILKSLPSFEERSQFTTWAMAIAVRTAISELRRRHFQDISLNQAIANGAEYLHLTDSDQSSAGESIDKQALFDELRDRVETDLTSRQREVIQALLGGMPVETIAEKLGMTRNAVYKQMYDARLKLKRSFEAGGTSSEEIQNILAGGA